MSRFVHIIQKSFQFTHDACMLYVSMAAGVATLAFGDAIVEERFLLIPPSIRRDSLGLLERLEVLR